MKPSAALRAASFAGGRCGEVFLPVRQPDSLGSTHCGKSSLTLSCDLPFLVHAKDFGADAALHSHSE